MHHLIEVAKNVRLYVQDWGEGKPIVFISGWPFDHRVYEYQFNAIPQKGFRCIGIDLRGFGGSDKPYGDYNYDIFADDVHQVLKHLKLKDITLVGHSMGGATTLRYAAKYQKEFVSKIILCGAAAPSLVQRPDFSHGFTVKELDDFIELCSTDRPKLLNTFSSIFYLSPKNFPEITQWDWVIGMQASAHATRECIKLFKTADLRPDMPKIEIPTLILHARADKVCPYPLGESLHKHIKGSKMVTFEKSGHGLYYDEREKFNTEIINFAK